MSAWGTTIDATMVGCADEINDDYSTGHVIVGGPPLVGGSERQFLPRPTPGAWEDRSSQISAAGLKPISFLSEWACSRATTVDGDERSSIESMLGSVLFLRWNRFGRFQSPAY